MGSGGDPAAARRSAPALPASTAWRARDRVFLHHGNTLEFFVDLLARVEPRGLRRPDRSAADRRSRSTTLARAARPRCSVWRGGDRSPRQASTDARRRRARLARRRRRARRGQSGGRPLERARRRSTMTPSCCSPPGTTGAPKGVVHTHRSLRARWTALQLRLGTSRVPPLAVPLADPLRPRAHLQRAVSRGSRARTCAVLPPFRSDVLMRLGSIIDDHEITFLSSVPALWRVALRASRPPRGGCARPGVLRLRPAVRQLWADIQEWAGTRDVANAYGITETGSWLAGATAADGPPEDGLVGEAWGGVVKVLRTASTAPGSAASPRSARQGERGYVWVNTPALMRGYLDADDLTGAPFPTAGSRRRTPGFRDERGRLYLTGRESEEINRGGHEDPSCGDRRRGRALRPHGRRVRVRLRRPDQGESVGIAVVLDRDQPEIRRGLYDWTRRYLAAHRVPQRWYVLDSIPRNANGKADRAGVARHCAESPRWTCGGRNVHGREHGRERRPR